jgi:hypothetical protein
MRRDGPLRRLLPCFLLLHVGIATAHALQVERAPLEADAALSNRAPPAVAADIDGRHGPFPRSGPPKIFTTFLQALAALQSTYFVQLLGNWPAANEWTAAVTSTHVSASLIAYINGVDTQCSAPCVSQDAGTRDALVNTYTDQLASFYIGEHDFTIVSQANDDKLWVVLAWLENLLAVQAYVNKVRPWFWFPTISIPLYADRAVEFWNLASQGWDTTLCGGGMIWDPSLAPYKNAITNQLYIAASASMYLYLPGSHDPKYLAAAVAGYRWLSHSGMTNGQGLYVDGFHITGWTSSTNIGTGKCDSRNDQVYTYNQGVLLSGLRGLWLGTGTQSYLDDGHTLIGNVVNATGWLDGAPASTQWSGLGRSGVLEDTCDADGSCGQDAQAFKGVFMHHLAIFCSPLPTTSGDSAIFAASPDLASLHARRCASYVPWIQHNAQAAAGTAVGNLYGMWWTAGLPPSARRKRSVEAEPAPALGIDYRSRGVPEDGVWRIANATVELRDPGVVVRPRVGRRDADPNGRGRGRTVETQGGGVAVLKALWVVGPGTDL